MFTISPTRLALVSLALLTGEGAAQNSITISPSTGGAAAGAIIGSVVAGEGEEGSGFVLPDGAVPMPDGAVQMIEGMPQGGGPGGEVDFNRLRQLIERSKKRPALTPAQQMVNILREQRFDRSPAGILATQLEEARDKEPAPQRVFGPESPQEFAARFQREAQLYRRDVVLGRWDKVREFLAALPQDSSAQAYQLLVQMLSAPMQVAPPPELMLQGAQPYNEAGYLAPADVLGLAAASPTPPDKKVIQMLAKLVTKDPRPPQDFFAALGKGVQHFGGEDAANRRRAAELLIEAGFVKDAGAFLPDLAQSREKKDYAALNLIARHRAELAARDKLAAGKDALPQAWEISTSFLTDTEAPPQERAEALSRALSIIPELGDDTGSKWIEKTFKDPKGEGLELLASLGTLTAQSRENPNAALRLEQLRLQHAAVKTLLAAQGVDPKAWSGIFTLFARQWKHEAEVTREKDQSNSRRMVQQFDDWGNLFFTRPNTGYQGPGTQPIGSGELLECQPDGAWLAAIDPATRNEVVLGTARLLLKVKEQSKALPLVKTLAATDRDEAKDLVREMIRVWTENHNPNEAQDYRSRYFYFYGFNNQSGSIPLTRSKQERNLVELAELVKGIRELKLGDDFHTELADAFITCHSKAEVWRVEAVESVFGSTDALDSATLATLASRMRMNLAGLWPNPKLQQAYQTKRKDKELNEQILTGYEAAKGVLVRALKKNPQQAWRLGEQLAALHFEESNFKSSLNPDNAHSQVKREALDGLAEAAKAYTKTLPLEDSSKESSGVFETWFFAALGSPTLEALKSHHVATPDEYPKIKAALAAIPEECRERHLKAFATTLNTRLANVAPDLKLRYLEGATAVAGEQEALTEAKDVLTYYRDLVKEIELDAEVDGPAEVGTESPFGLRINLRHTREIERESGGFQKYLQNQTNSMYGFNYGRPTEDYRDKFEKTARAALEEQFEVVSVTFHSDKTESRTDAQFGWRLTPYAYLLLKPKGPQIDKVPPLKIDLDFTDTSGYVVLPITSGEVPLDAGKTSPRPFHDLKVTQTLDERSHAEKGSLYLEMKASAHGLVPSLKELCDLKVDGFETGNIEDRGLRVVELDGASDDLAPVSEHEWRVELKPVRGRMPDNFAFPVVKPELAKEDGLVRQRYVDVDLVPADASVALTGVDKKVNPWGVGAIVALIALATGLLAHFRKGKELPPEGPNLIPLPTHINAVSVIGYLKRLQEREGVQATTKESIGKEIAILETRYFGRDDVPQDPVILEEIARRWQVAA
ncbi:hypothetical protein [Haloferula sp. BvORR071]|uniref:hypothetical protein n=1 Tax=Haloferula sp. BvORR071 TaxID=1396141 RepID=UPI00055395A9|nr:hypothetical protein [Haloferula sp. BvORR071]